MVIEAKLPGRLLSLEVEENEHIKKGQLVALLDSMKLENPVTAPADGTVVRIFARAGSLVRAGEPIMEIRPGREGSRTRFEERPRLC